MCKSGCTRRRFLGTAALGTGGLLLANLLPRPLWAQSVAARRRFVFAYFEGGWDILLGLDPRDPATTNPAQHEIDPAYGQLPYGYASRGVQRAGNLAFGPAVPASFLAHAGDAAIINGIGMDTASHEAGRRYFITGRFPRGITAVGSSTPAEIVAQTGELSPIPYLAAGVEAYAENLPAYATALGVNSITDIAVAFTPFLRIDTDVMAGLQAFQDTAPGCEAIRHDRDGVVSTLRRNQLKAREFVSGEFAGYFDLTRTDAEMVELRQRYGLDAYGGPDTPEVLAFVAGQALKNDVCQCVSVRIARDLDTHSDWAQDQAPRQEQGWAALAALIGDLKNAPLPEDPSRTLFDETTVVVFSEFGRTPLFNALDGRDHFLGSSALVAGAGVAHNLTVGKSAAVGMMPVETDLDTGLGIDNPTDAQRAGGRLVTLSPKSVLATVLASAGLDYSHLRAEPIRALLL